MADQDEKQCRLPLLRLWGVRMVFGAIIAAKGVARSARFMAKGGGGLPDPDDDKPDPYDDRDALPVALAAIPLIILTICMVWP